MTQIVQDQIFFHVNMRRFYNPYSAMAVGQKITIGGGFNPFFDYFRKNISSFTLRKQDGTQQEIPALNFLRNVKEGYITPDNLPLTAFQIAEHYVILTRELIFEITRMNEFVDAPSRQRGIWLSDGDENLNFWSKLLPSDTLESFQLVEVKATGRAHGCDAGFLIGDSELYDESLKKAHAYWSGEIASKNSQPEVLFEGELEVVRIMNI